MQQKPTPTEIDNFSDDQMKQMFRNFLLDNKPELNNQPALLQQQTDFLFDRSNNFGNETLSESEISDVAYKLGLVDNNFVVRKISNCFDFSKQ